MNTRKFYIISLPFISARLNVLALLGSIIIYIALSIYLYRPHLSSFEPWRGVLIPAANIGATGTFLLATRWVSNPVGAFFAGLIYAFGPFTLGFALYHPLASSLTAAIPWLFLPSAFWPHKPSKKSAVITSLLMTIPILVIVLFFIIAAKYGFFPIPITESLHFKPYLGLLTPLVLGPGDFPYLSFYHAGIAPLVFGLLIYIRLRRIAPAVIFTIGIVFSLLGPLGPVSPIAWAVLSVLFLSILTGIGLNGIVLATEHDRTSLTISGMVMAALAITSAYLVRYFGPAISDASIWYFLSCLAIFVIIILSHTQGQYHPVRWIVFSAVFAADVFVNTKSVVDKLF